ncbi:MAG: hypothetical protein U1F76_04345 [Candidatus Competibacteraceae bacterium]
MDIEGKNVLVLGGCGLVGIAVCRELLLQQPAVLSVASRRKEKAERAVRQLQTEFPQAPTRILPVWGDVFLRAEWQADDVPTRTDILADPAKRRCLIADILDPLNDNIIASSLLTHLIQGTTTGLNGTPAHVVVDCMNTATRVAYQDIYTLFHKEILEHRPAGCWRGCTSILARMDVTRRMSSRRFQRLGRCSC